MSWIARTVWVALLLHLAPPVGAAPSPSRASALQLGLRLGVRRDWGRAERLRWSAQLSLSVEWETLFGSRPPGSAVQAVRCPTRPDRPLTSAASRRGWRERLRLLGCG